MPSSAFHPKEEARIQALHHLAILDTEADPLFDGLAQLASKITGTPIAAVSLVDTDRQWFKARVGLDACETPRSQSFCSHSLLKSEELLIVEDATQDDRFADNPLVTGAPNIRFYAGAPLIELDTHLPLGALCVIDSEPRQLSEDQLSALRILARQTEQLLMQRKAERALRESESKLHGVLNHSSNFMGLMDTQGHLLHANLPALKASGVALEDVFGIPFWETPWWTHDKQQQARLKEAACRAASGERDAFQATHITSSGDTLEIDFSLSPVHSATGEVIFLVPEGRDVTARNAANRVLEERDRLIQLSHDAIFTWTEADGIRSWNEGATLLYGFGKEEALGAVPHELLRSQHPVPWSEVQSALRSEGEWMGQVEHTAKNGRKVVVTARHQAIQVGEETIVLETNRDVSQEVQAQQELEEANRELEHFAYVASHDLRTPLRGIANLATFIRDDEEDLSQESLANLEKLVERAKSVETMLADMLSYSRAGNDRGPVTEIQAAELIANAVELALPPERFDIQIEEGMPTLETHELPLQQAFLNLIDNAIKYHDKEAGTIQVSAQDLGEFVQFTVADDGPGIDPKYHEKVLEMFQRLQSKDTISGTGLGLALIRKSIRKLGGELWLESEVGAGSTFHFTWPKTVLER